MTSNSWIPSESLTDLRPCRELLDSNFDGYKLSLDKLPMYSLSLSCALDEPQASEHQLSLLHAKRVARHNFLFMDPWYLNDVYFVDSNWFVCRVRVSASDIAVPLDPPCSIVQFPGAADRRAAGNGRCAPSMQFISATFVAVADGAGRLILYETGQRDMSNCWETVFSEEPLGANVAFELLSVLSLSPSQIDCLLLHVNESEEVGKPTTALLNWLAFSLQPDSGMWQIARRRRLVSSCLPDYATLQPTNNGLVLGTERSWRWELDSTRPLLQTASSSERAAAVDKSDGRVGGYTWSQTKEDVTLRFEFEGAVAKADISIENDGRRLLVALRGETLVDGCLLEHVDSTQCTWTLLDNVLEIFLGGNKSRYWETLLLTQSEESWRGREILSEERASLVESSVLNEEEAGVVPYNNQELEDVDMVEAESYERSALVWIDGDEHVVTAAVNLDGHQWLFNTQLQPGASASGICLRHDVDGLVWQGEAGTWRHLATFPALGYVQASKSQRRLTCSPPSCSYAVMMDYRRHVYVYQQPLSLATELRHRPSGRQVARLARQHVLTLQEEASLLGCAAAERWFLVASAQALYLVYIQ